MLGHLITTSETYRIDSENHAMEIVEEAKKDNRFTLMKSSITYKHYNETKNKPEEEFWVVVLQKKFNELRDPDSTVSVEYKVENGYFPQVDSIEKEPSTEVEF